MYKTLEIQEKGTFQKYNWFYERLMWFIFLIALLAGLAGFFGSGYFSDIRIGQNSDLQIQYSRFLHDQTDSQINFQINPKSNGPIELWINSNVLSFLSISDITPKPRRTDFKENKIVYTYNLDPTVRKMQVVFTIKPIKIGSVNWHAGLVSGINYQIKQFTYP